MKKVSHKKKIYLSLNKDFDLILDKKNSDQAPQKRVHLDLPCIS
jgi:hypothetical protein